MIVAAVRVSVITATRGGNATSAIEYLCIIYYVYNMPEVGLHFITLRMVYTGWLTKHVQCSPLFFFNHAVIHT